MALLLSFPPLANLHAALVWLRRWWLGSDYQELVRGARAGSLGSPFEELSFVSEHFEIGLRNILGWADAEAQRKGTGLRHREVGKVLG